MITRDSIQIMRHFILLGSSMLLSIICLFNANVFAQTRIKDIASVEGVRENLLVGQGLVVGLNGTGDNLQNIIFTEKSLADFLERLGMNVHGASIKTKNIATVTVTANLPPFSSRGSKIDIRVSSLGDAKSLKDGILLPTPLVGADGNVYAVAQGSVSVSNFTALSPDVKTPSKSLETNGYIQAGAIVEEEIDFELKALDSIKLALHSPDFNTAISMAKIINTHIEGNTATALDPGTVEVIIPSYQKENLVNLLAKIETLEIEPDYKAKIVINQSTGTVVIGDKVHIRPVAIAQGNLVVNVGHTELQEKSGPGTDPQTLDNLNFFVDSKRGSSIRQLEKTASLSDLVSGLNKLGVYPNDIINILHNMKAVGALDAVIEVK